jgi:hypothetical protein
MQTVQINSRSRDTGVSTEKTYLLENSDMTLIVEQTFINLVDRFARTFSLINAKPYTLTQVINGLIDLPKHNININEIIDLLPEMRIFVDGTQKSLEDEYYEQTIWIDTEIPKYYSLPNDLVYFLLKFNNAEISIFEYSDKSPIFIPIDKWKIATELYHNLNLFEDDEGTSHPYVISINNQYNPIYCREWFKIFHDNMSVDNGNGSLIININPKSPYYKAIFAYSSSDEAVITKVANNFTELLEYCVKNSSKIREYNIGIVDFLNGFEKLD